MAVSHGARHLIQIIQQALKFVKIVVLDFLERVEQFSCSRQIGASMRKLPEDIPLFFNAGLGLIDTPLNFRQPL